MFLSIFDPLSSIVDYVFDCHTPGGSQKDTRSGAQTNVSAICLFHHRCPCNFDISAQSVLFSTEPAPLGGDHNHIGGDDGMGVAWVPV